MRTEPCNSWCVYDKGVCRFCGWPKDRSKMALRFYDIQTNDYRDCTQADLDELLAIRTAYGRIQARYAEDRAQLLADIKAVRSRAGLPNDLMVDGRLIGGHFHPGDEA